MNRYPSRLLTLLAFLTLMTSGCASNKLNYKIDPEISGSEQLKPHATRVYVKVIDKRKAADQEKDKDVIAVLGPEDEAEILEKLLIKDFGRKNFQLINKPLLADIAIELHIEELSAKVKKSWLKSEVITVSRIRLKANRKTQPLEKVFNKTLRQEVANPVNENDVTGVVNQLLSSQLSTMLSDPKLVELARSTQ